MMGKQILLFLLVAIASLVFGGALPLPHVAVLKRTATSTQTSSFNDTIRIAVSARWNMISLPLNVPDGRMSVLFPDAVVSAFGYGVRYFTTDTLCPHVGYWMKFSAAETISVVGDINLTDTLRVKRGWNLVGGVSMRTAVGDLMIDPAGIVVSKFFAYVPQRGYAETDTLEPGRAYWVKCRGDGELHVSTNGPMLLSPANGNENQQPPLTLIWHSVANANGYRIQMTTDPIFSTVLVDDTTLSDTVEHLCFPRFGGNIYWRVRAIFGDSVGGWSERWKFQTPVVPPLAPPIPDSLALFASVDGTPTGLLIFDPNTLEPIDSFVLHGPVPWSLVISPDASTWYSAWQVGINTDTLYAIDARTKAIVNQVPTNGRGTQVISDKDKKYLITFDNGVTEFRDRINFSVVHRDSPYTVTQGGVMSSNEPRFYGWAPRGSESNFLVYNLDSFKVEKTFNVEPPGGCEVVLSPDDRYLYALCDMFYVVDLTTHATVAKFPAVYYTNMGVSPDGKYVYLTNLPCEVCDFGTTWQVLRYDVETGAGVYIDWRNFPGLSGVWTSDQVVVSPDSRSLYLTVDGLTRTCSGEYVRLLRIDTESKTVLQTFTFPVDAQGNVHQVISRLWLGKYVR